MENAGKIEFAADAGAPVQLPEICFNPPPQNLELRNGEAHVFCAALDQPPSRLECFEEILSDDERARAARFVFARDRDRFVAGRGILREILGWLLHADPARLAFAYGEHGKPKLAAPVAERFLHFNLAHSDALAVYLVSAQAAVGIDLERVRPLRDAEAIAARFFPARQNAEWRSLSTDRRERAFFERWTHKEALLKAIGCGLGAPLNQIQVPLSPDHGASRPLSSQSTADVLNFIVHLLTPVPGYQAAAATRSSGAPTCWKWPAA
jgi:4'-phosphopantetheinyl transferase